MAKEVSKNQIKESKKNIKDKKSFGKDFKAELKRVVWPTPAELAKSTLAVIAIVVVIVVIVFCLDFVFESMNKYGVDKLKNTVQTAEDKTTTEENSENANTESETSTENNVEETTENVAENTTVEVQE